MGDRRIGLRVGAILTCLAAVVSGCQFDGLNSLSLPGTAGHGPGSFEVTVELDNVVGLPQNSPVKVGDVTVGSVSGVVVMQRADSTVYAAVRLSLDRQVELPANISAAVGQTSLLGSQHVELIRPADRPAPVKLADGAHIRLGRTGHYPTTEEVLAALGVIINNGNLGSLQDITDAAYAAVVGRGATFTGLVAKLAELTTFLDTQTSTIIAAAEGVDRTAAALARGADALRQTLETLPAALDVLNRNRANIVAAFGALRRLASTAERVVSQTRNDLAADLKDTYPLIKALNDNADDVIHDLEILPTFPFAQKYLRNAVRGDYLNVFSTFDLTLRRLGENLLTTSRLDPNMPRLSEIVNPPDFLMGALSNLSGQAADPFRIPPGTATQHGAKP
ncbi:MCE family protein [Mycolicibacterium phocaicum]|uniref:Mammalian cell entry protein n=1 Tax=Mycolicibacterium phocaicum TaxID=319706 RepID=A0A7I7ZSS9_9MYCO|nr:MCE family protein [Mycolicibacterium phocaicum]TLH61194.1 mammalian cell entry protein [Mycolicibacterium phocaicum]TXH17266.1 MAG: MCE family protein [Mycobacterium sp.]BBZ57160.1 mammalian cell entry protein [Mycolicibacterium phocaicum]